VGGIDLDHSSARPDRLHFPPDELRNLDPPARRHPGVRIAGQRVPLGAGDQRGTPAAALTVSVFLLEVVPLELQRRIVDNLVKDHPYSRVIVLCAVYPSAVLVQGGTKLGLNVYRGWVGERATRDLRHRIH
jgi:hypothetical protein